MSNSSALPTSHPLLTAELCDELNKNILRVLQPQVEALKVTTDSNSPASLNTTFTILLSHIIFLAKRLLQREGLPGVLISDSMGNILPIVEQYSQLRDIIQTACREGKFGHVIDLQLLQITKPTASWSQDTKNTLYNPFKRPYVGEAVSHFVEYLTTNNKKFSENFNRRYYAKFCSIVQSSGTGKTRLLTELHKKDVLVLYMSLHENNCGFPDWDEYPSRILTEDLTQCSQARYTARCCAFFAAIFMILKKELRILISSMPALDAIKAWNGRMCDMGSTNRNQFFTEVEKEYRKIHISIVDRMNESVEKQEGTSDTPRPSKKHESDRPADDSSILEGESFLMDAYASMLDALPQIFNDSDDRPRLVIGIDEVHSLSQYSNGFRPSHVLCRVINAYSRSGRGSVWAVFASTASQVADFLAPQPIHDSLRIPAADALADVSAQAVAVFGHIAGFGRPLWKSFSKTEEADIDSIMTIAKQKLCGSKEPSTTYENQALVVLSQRFALDICFGHPEAISYITEGVKSHLRICYSITEDRKWSFTDYPSEPLLSCAAASILHETSSSLENALKTLKNKVDGGMFEIGQSGKLTSRLLLLLAKDSFVRKRAHNPAIPYTITNGSEVELIDCQKVSVVKFLEHLFGDSFWSKAGDTAKNAFERAYVNFSHWVHMSEFISPTGLEESERCTAEEWTLRHWHRTAAVQCCHLQPLVDKMIPIYFDNPNTDDIRLVSQMFVLDNAGKIPNKKERPFLKRTDASIECRSALPFIALLLDLNGEQKLNVSFGNVTPHHDQYLQIHASGLNCNTFSFLRNSPVVEQLLKDLISKPEEPPTDLRLDGLMKYGDTVRRSHMRWEETRDAQL